MDGHTTFIKIHHCRNGGDEDWLDALSPAMWGMVWSDSDEKLQMVMTPQHLYVPCKLQPSSANKTLCQAKQTLADVFGQSSWHHTATSDPRDPYVIVWCPSLSVSVGPTPPEPQAPAALPQVHSRHYNEFINSHKRPELTWEAEGRTCRGHS